MSVGPKQHERLGLIGTRANTTYDAEAKGAKDELRRTFEPLIRAAAMRNQTDEVRKLTFQMEYIINPDGTLPDGVESSAAVGSDFKQLVGKWVSKDSPTTQFEFKSPRTLSYTYTYTSNSGGGGSRTEEFKVTNKPDKIVIERKDSSGYSESYKNWYEIKIPYNAEALEIINYNESPQSKSKNTIILVRKAD